MKRVLHYDSGRSAVAGLSLNFIVLPVSNRTPYLGRFWSVHTSANLIFHFSYKNGKRKYYLS